MKMDEVSDCSHRKKKKRPCFVTGLLKSKLRFWSLVFNRAPRTPLLVLPPGAIPNSHNAPGFGCGNRSGRDGVPLSKVCHGRPCCFQPQHSLVIPSLSRDSLGRRQLSCHTQLSEEPRRGGSEDFAPKPEN